MITKLREDLKGKTILVFGASSNIGRKFIQEAARRGGAVIAVARDTSKISPLAMRKYKGNINVMKADITKRNDVEKTFRNRKVDATINFAVDFSANILKAKIVNVIGEQYVIEESIKARVKRHIYISTIATQMSKANAYRDTKLEAENKVKSIGKSIDWVILRYGNVLGTRTWDHPFKIIVPFIRLAIPKLPTDARDADFYYVTIETAIEATLAALVARPNQVITVFDGKVTIGEYLSVMEKIYNVRFSFLPSKLLQFIDKLFGRYLPTISGLSAAAEFLANSPEFENATMKRELVKKTRYFYKWIQEHWHNSSSLH